jgi:putative Holliday junction resolvase
MGLDIGTKKIGVALSDEMGWTAQALETIHRKGIREDLTEIKRLIERYGVDEVVVGLPFTMAGKVGPQAMKVIEFSKILNDSLSVPVYYWDERLSTKAVTRILLNADLSRKKRKKVVDRMAAAFILQGYMDLKARQKSMVEESMNGEYRK